MKSETISARFWEKIDRSGDCWEWTGAKNRAGYGRFGVRRYNMIATRVMMMFKVGMYDRRLVVRHTCDNPGCVNPDHLLLGTHQNNSDDMVARGRQVGANALKTHCSRGHALTGDNIRQYVYDGYARRYCKTCEHIHYLNRKGGDSNAI